MKRLYRSRNERMIAGVAGGLAEYFNVDPTLVRLAFVAFTLAGGAGVLLYLVLAIIVPLEPLPGSAESMQNVNLQQSTAHTPPQEEIRREEQQSVGEAQYPR